MTLYEKHLTESITRHLNRLHEIRESRGQYVLQELYEFLQTELDEMREDWEELRNMLASDYPDQQLKLNYELDQAAERRVSA